MSFSIYTIILIEKKLIEKFKMEDLLQMEEILFPELELLFDQAKNDPNSFLADCGKCKINQNLIDYCYQNYYPYCRCIVENYNFVVQSKENEQDDYEKIIPQDSLMHPDIRDLINHENSEDEKKCPKGYRIVTRDKYDILFYNGQNKIETILSLNDRYRKRFHDIISIRGKITSWFLSKEQNNKRSIFSLFIKICKDNFEDKFVEISKPQNLLRDLMKFEWFYVD